MHREKKVLAILTILFTLSIGYAQLTNLWVTQAAGTKTDVNSGPQKANRLDTFEAFTDGSSVSLRWSTGGEAGNLGFNVYRDADGNRELLNAAPIVGSALRTSVELVASDQEYSWIDDEPKSDAVYYLEDIDVDGTTTMHGPVSPTFKIFVNRFENNSALLSDLTRTGSPAEEKELVGEREATDSIYDQAYQWQIAGQSGVKISVDHDGWYRVSSAELQSAGFETNSNRVNWRLFVNSEEVPMRVNYDGSIEFYGRGTDMLESDQQVYYLIQGSFSGARLMEVKGGALGEDPAESYPVTVQRANRSIYVSSLLNGDAENWFGAVINSTTQTVENLTLNKVAAQNSAHVSIKLQGLSAGSHLVNVTLNDFALGAVTYADTQNPQFEFEVPASALLEGVNAFKLQSLGGATDVSLVDKISVRYARRYEAVNNSIHFTVAAGEAVNVSGFSTPKFTLYEIQNGRVTRQIIPENNLRLDHDFGFGLASANYQREFIAMVNSQTEQPALSEPNVPSSWNDPTNKADLVIIAPTLLRTQAAQLAQMRQLQGLKSEVVLTDDIADEFGSGVLTSNAIKQFLQQAATNWQIKPKYAVLFGDSSYDMHGYLPQGKPNLVPTRLIDTAFMETASDTWLADFDNDGIENIGLGRLPAANTTEASFMISKLIRYDNQASRTQKTDVLISDRYFESYNTLLQANLPNTVQSIRIDRASMTDAEFRTRLLAEQNNTPMVITYTGHGSTGVWSSMAIFSSGDASNLTNSKLSFYMLMTCMNGFTHNTSGDSLAEALLKAENGAVGAWASSAIITAEGQSPMSQKATKLIFQNNNPRIGDIARLAKAMTTDTDVRRTWQLIGDPTIFVK